MAMDVARQDSREANGDVAPANDVGGSGEGEVVRPDRRAFDTLVNAQEFRVGVDSAPPRGFDEVDELCANVMSLGRKSSDGQSAPANVERERPRSIEQVDTRVLSEPDLRNASAFVIPGDDEDRNASVGDASQWLECLPCDARGRARAIENIAAVDDDVDVTVECRLECGRVIREKVMSAPASLDARPRRQVEAEVGVSEEEDAGASGHVVNIGVIRDDKTVACQGRLVMQ